MAGRLFTGQTWTSIVCGLLVLIASRAGDEPARMDWGQGALAFVLAGMLLAAVAEFGVAPRIVARENLRLWHAVGSAMYLLQWLCASLVLWRVAGERPQAG
jgi:hypothetical protein